MSGYIPYPKRREEYCCGSFFCTDIDVWILIWLEKLETSMNVNDGNALRNFKSLSKKEMECLACGYVGVFGLKSQTFKNAISIIGFALVIMGMILAVITGAGLMSSYFMNVIFGIFLILAGVVRSNRFQCPKCKSEINSASFTRLNPWHSAD